MYMVLIVFITTSYVEILDIFFCLVIKIAQQFENFVLSQWVRHFNSYMYIHFRNTENRIKIKKQRIYDASVDIITCWGIYKNG